MKWLWVHNGFYTLTLYLVSFYWIIILGSQIIKATIVSQPDAHPAIKGSFFFFFFYQQIKISLTFNSYKISLFFKQLEIDGIYIENSMPKKLSKKGGLTSRCGNATKKKFLESGCKKSFQKQPVHIFTPHIGHIKLAYCTVCTLHLLQRTSE